MAAPTQSSLTNPRLLEPIAASMWFLWPGVLLATVEFRQFGVDMLPSAIGMVLILFAARGIGAECLGSGGAIVARGVMVAAGLGAAVELPRTIGWGYGGVFGSAYELFLAAFTASLGALAWVIGTRCYEYGFARLGWVWRATGAGLAGLVAAPWAALVLIDLIGAPLRETVPARLDATVGTVIVVGRLLFIVVGVVLWRRTSRAARGRPAVRRDVQRSGSRCARCGYDLIGLPAPICPECGAEGTPAMR